WVPGVRGVNLDQLQVRPTPSLSQAGRATALTDEEIRQAILKALAFDARVGSMHLDVEVEDRVVTLRGDVASRGAKDAAVQLAQNTGGVGEVVDQLNVASQGERSDEQIAAALRRAFRSSAVLADDEVQVTVERGRVALRGVVD